MAVQSIDSILERPTMGRYRWTIYLLCGILMALEGYDAYIVANLAAVIARDLDIPIPSMAYVFSAQAAGMALGFYTIPVLADRIGRRNIILVGATFFGLLTLLSTAVQTLEMFTLVRFLAFAAMGGTMPNIVALATEFMPENRRGKLLTWLYIGHGLGASVAGLVGPSFVHFHSWQSALWGGGIALLLLVPYLYVRLPESCRYLMTRNPRDPRVAQILGKIAPDLQLAPDTIFVSNEERNEGSPVIGLFKSGRAPMTLLLWVAMGSTLCVVATLTSWLPSFLHLLGGVETGAAARMSSVSAFGAIAGPILLTLLMQRLGLAPSLALMSLLGFAAMTCFYFVSGYHALGWFLGFAYGFFVIAVQAGLNSLVASSYPTSMRSTGIGWAGGIGRVTSMIGPAVGGVMLAAQVPGLWIYMIVASPLLLTAIAMILFHVIVSGPALSARTAKGVR
ncbi:MULTISPECIES: MFS transporter [unclassified Sphingobium]|uniref:MFS transporter n=1 Tax=unclassified Sphingobium TaxID=2611147 RepID=UPI002224329D|nr:MULTISPECIES: MFS transporter [unclassified Sphingobium]MCW2380859.1 AAHS family 4-hydroxybenzoate transporter-like MFS transporter [Sphingobium sp. B2D3B]MCW2399034.1 AAHS family 4-hydroxybenzoate transporter-like MFS transporter [Sphingobium sp. B2D3C]